MNAGGELFPSFGGVPTRPLHNIYFIIENIRRLLTNKPTISHIFREVKQCVDTLAKLGFHVNVTIANCAFEVTSFGDFLIPAC